MLHQTERVPHHYTLDEPASQPETAAPSLRLRSTDEHISQTCEFFFEAIRDNVFRTTFSSREHPIPPYPSVRRPEPTLGASAPKVTTDATAKTREIHTSTARAVIDWSDAPVVSLYLENGADSGLESINGAANGNSHGADPVSHVKPVHSDLPYRSYALDSMGAAYYSVYRKGALHVGLGEKAAPMDLSGRGFLVSACDTFGYDAYRTDPLYKHIPLLISAAPPSPSLDEDGIEGPAGCVGIFSTSHARSVWSVGSEIDGLWGRYKVHRQAHGGLEQYLIVGRTVADVVRSYADLAGYPLRVPRYMMGYVGGGMKYSMEDEPRACDSILNFVKRCEEEGMPVSAFQMSSGYTVAETEPKTRNVFTWNRHRFPDPKAFTDECHRRGVRLLANIKPYVLANHPAYRQLLESGAFFRDPVTKTTAVARLWSAGGGESGEGSHIDFTSRAGYDWWYKGCLALKEVGIDAMWNDNNEYNLPSDEWECALETISWPKADSEAVTGAGLAPERKKSVGLWGRALHCELMGRSSHDACVDMRGDERPMVLTRSATTGTMKYAASSWSGDNVTSWEGMKGANALALNAGFSLLQCYGHDIGGFEGPQPTPEHLVRWIQLGVHSPRFAINCYKTNPRDNLVGEVIEPWQFPSVSPLVRAAIHRRYELVPYTYSLCLKAHLTALPPQRWTGWGYEHDSGVWTPEVKVGDTQFWFGDALIIAGVYEPGCTTAPVYLPAAPDASKDYGYLNTNAPYQHLESGRWHEISSIWHSSIPVIARVGSAIPVAKGRPTTSYTGERDRLPSLEEDDWRGVEIFPPPLPIESTNGTKLHTNGTNGMNSTNGHTTDHMFENTWLEDDGISPEAKAEMCEVRVVYSVSSGATDAINVSFEAKPQGKWTPMWLPNGVNVILPVGEERLVRTKDVAKSNVVDKGRDTKGRRVWQVAVNVTSA